MEKNKITTINDLLDLPLREVLDNYISVESLECGYKYGITKIDDANKIFDEYNIQEDYAEAFYADNLISDELLIDCDKPILSYEKLETICNNLGISKKTSGADKQ